jgi:uncharacterized protein
MSGVAPQSYSVQADFNVAVPMRDGVSLRANIFRPLAEGPFPVLVCRMPYGKDLPLANSALNLEQTARQGYIVIVQDVRGRFASEGEYVPFLNEREDGYDTIEWAAALPGSNGAVGMFGPSYMGYTQWAAARTRPPHLKAIFPLITWADSHDGPSMRGGAIELGLTRHWTLINTIDTELRLARATGDPRAMYAAIARVAAELDGLPVRGYQEVPVVGFGKRRGTNHFDSADEGIRRRADAEFTDLSGNIGGYETLADLPAYHMGGWYDIFLGGTLRNFSELARRGKSPQRLLIGPWTHTSMSEQVGSVHFGFAASASLINLQADLPTIELRWFDHFLKGIPNGVEQEPPVQIFIMGINQWRAEQEWPLNRAVPTPFYLHSDGHANSQNGDGVLSTTSPDTEATDHYAYDPLKPVPTYGGPLLIHPIFQSGPQDQRPIEKRDDVLVFTSTPLEQAIEVTGPITVTLFASTDAVDTDFVARLVDVHPDGFARPLTDGIIRGRVRHGFDREELLTPGQVYDFTIDLWATSNVFLPGHRIRLDITSSNFPRWDRNLNTGAPYGEGSEAVTAHQTILHDREHPSHIMLPVVPA